MKKRILTTIFLTTLNFNFMIAQTHDDQKVKETVIQFADAGDKRNAAALDKLLDDNFRMCMNQLFGSKTLMFLSKQDYLAKINAKEFGGDKRTVTIEQLVIFKNNASLKATFRGSKLSVVTLLHLVKDSNNDWKLINDVPAVE